jgi:hypothetical protein
MQPGSEGHAHLKLTLFYLGRAIGSLANCLAHPCCIRLGTSKQSLEIYQHLSLDSVEDAYQEAAAAAELRLNGRRAA